MADLSKIKVGDKLRLEVEALRVCEADTKSGWQVEVRTVSRRSACGFLSGGLVDAAEHIPAPRIFKRGDWVKLNFSDPQSVRQNGIVLRLEQRTTVSLGSRVEVEVSWPDGQIHWYVPNDLEPDEAPE